MNLQSIVTSLITTSALIAALLWLFRHLILTRLRESVAHEFDTKLEQLRSIIRVDEAQGASLRKAALTTASGHSNITLKRQAEAIDALWQGFLETKKLSQPMQFLTSLKLDNVAKELNDPKVQLFLDTLFPDSTANSGDVFGTGGRIANQARPWVTELAWAYYVAYASMVLYALSWTVIARKAKEDPAQFLSHESVNQVLVAAIPALKIDTSKDNIGIYPAAAEALEKLLVAELKRMIEGRDVDETSVGRAAKIIEAANVADQDRATAKSKASV